MYYVARLRADGFGRSAFSRETPIIIGSELTMIEMTSLPPLFGVLVMVCAFVIYVVMTRYAEGGEKIKKIAKAIHEGAIVFMHR